MMRLLSCFSLAGLLLSAGVHSATELSPAYTFSGESEYDNFGRSVSGAGDVNNDGFDDLIVGAWANETAGDLAGRAYVYSGQSGALLYTFTGEAEWNRFGWSVSGAGDVNNDGFDDLIVGAGTGGRAYVYSGQGGTLIYTLTEYGLFGWSVSDAGDVNNDGFDDVIVGAQGPDAGRSYVYAGQSGALLYTFAGESAGDQFGFSVSGAGDVNNDGFDDLIVGAKAYGAGLNDTGRAYVYSGESGSLLYTFTGEAVWDYFGDQVSGAGDVNNDGFDDMIIGAPGYGAGIVDTGRAYVYSGQSGALLYIFTGGTDIGGFGYSVSDAGDVNNDGFDDLIVGAQGNDAEGGNYAERVYVYSGSNGALLYAITSEATALVGFGYSVSNAGDVNNDGLDDLIVGAHYNGTGDSGWAYVYTSGFICGNIDNSSSVDVADLTYLIDYLFRGGPPPAWLDAADVDGSGGTDVADLTYMVDYLFGGGPGPVCQ